MQEGLLKLLKVRKTNRHGWRRVGMVAVGDGHVLSTEILGIDR